MKLLGDHILVERVKSAKASTTGGILLPPVALDDYNTGGLKEFRVLAVGPGRRNRKGVTVALECSPGDRVICESYTEGAEVLDDGRMVIRSSFIVAVVPLQK